MVDMSNATEDRRRKKSRKSRTTTDDYLTIFEEIFEDDPDASDNKIVRRYADALDDDIEALRDCLRAFVIERLKRIYSKKFRRRDEDEDDSAETAPDGATEEQEQQAAAAEPEPTAEEQQAARRATMREAHYRYLAGLEMPNGKALRDCTCGEVTGFSKRFAKLGKLGQPDQLLREVADDQRIAELIETPPATATA